MARYSSVYSAVDRIKKELLNDKVFIKRIKEVEKERSIGDPYPFVRDGDKIKWYDRDGTLDGEGVYSRTN